MNKTKCQECGKEYEAHRKTSKFCSGKCRAAHSRKNPQNKITRVQMQALYNMAVSALEELKNHAPANLPSDFQNIGKIGVLHQNGSIEPLSFSSPQNALKSFEYYRLAKKEIQNEDDWVKMAAEIRSASNLTDKQKTLLLTTNN